MEEKIIFLDFDGVINDSSCMALTECVESLKQIIKNNNARIVVISSRQQNGTIARRNKIIKFLRECTINAPIDFIDPNFEGSLGDIPLPRRVLGIIDYLKRYPNTEYVILDDEYQKDYQLVNLNHHRTPQFKGLSARDINRVEFKLPPNEKYLNLVTYQYRKLGAYEQATNDVINVLKKVQKIK